MIFRAVGMSENPGVPVLFGGYNLPLLVEIGLTDLPKSGGAMASPAPPGNTGLTLTMFELKSNSIDLASTKNAKLQIAKAMKQKCIFLMSCSKVEN